MGLFDGIIGAIGGFFTGGPAGAIVGGLQGLSTGRRQEQQLDAMREQNRFSAEQAQINRDFQERMASTQYTRAVGDLKEAGLNPMLALGGPNASPAGSAAAGQQAPQLEDKLAAVINSASTAATTKANIDNLRETNKLIEAQKRETESRTKVNLATIPKMEAEQESLLASAGQSRAQEQTLLATIPKIEAEIQNLKMQTEHEAVKIAATQALADLHYWQQQYTKGEISLQGLQANIMRAVGELETNRLPLSRNEAAAQESWFKRNISPFLPDILKSTGSAASASRFFK